MPSMGFSLQCLYQHSKGNEFSAKIKLSKLVLNIDGMPLLVLAKVRRNLGTYNLVQRLCQESCLLTA